MTTNKTNGNGSQATAVAVVNDTDVSIPKGFWDVYDVDLFGKLLAVEANGGNAGRKVTRAISLLESMRDRNKILITDLRELGIGTDSKSVSSVVQAANRLIEDIFTLEAFNDLEFELPRIGGKRGKVMKITSESSERAELARQQAEQRRAEALARREAAAKLAETDVETETETA